MLRLKDLMAACFHILPPVILIMLFPMRKEIENENKINQHSSENIRVISLCQE